MHARVLTAKYDTNIHIMEDSSCVEKLIDMSNIEVMRNQSQVICISGRSRVGIMKDFSYIGIKEGISIIGTMEDYSIARDCRSDSIKILTPENFDLIAYKK